MLAARLLIILVLLQYFFFSLLVGRARGRFGVKAPAVAGHEIFERYFRVQMNTLELLVLLIPALWIAGEFIAPLWIAILGGVYLVGRVIYFRSYIQAPEKRSVGFGLSVLPILLLLITDLLVLLHALLAR